MSEDRAQREHHGKELRPYKVYAIANGVVIDHIPAKRALQVLEILGVHPHMGEESAKLGGTIVTLGMNMESSKLGRKDIVKIENKELSKAELNKIALIAPEATVNIIRDSQVTEKFQIAIPSFLEHIVKCPNQNCITNHEAVKTKFVTITNNPLHIKCHFCERVVDQQKIHLVGQ
ncbi:aspartate carbamoyltransferase regulatory subunit [Candidatus Woesearchaeota archaeon]|nr:aspartate carbamoyltransferase regulatory subunit [Candidatus Woesearchaeota archaeon]